MRLAKVFCCFFLRKEEVVKRPVNFGWKAGKKLKRKIENGYYMLILPARLTPIVAFFAGRHT